MREKGRVWEGEQKLLAGVNMGKVGKKELQEIYSILFYSDLFYFSLSFNILQACFLSLSGHTDLDGRGWGLGGGEDKKNQGQRHRDT